MKRVSDTTRRHGRCCVPPQTILVRVTGLDRPGATSDLLTLLANLDAADASDVPNDSHAA